MNKTKYEKLDIISRSQLKVLSLVAEGLSDEEIADKLILSKHTVKSHIKDISDKLNISDKKNGGSHKRVRLALYYIRNYQK